jgi:glucose dehydrogenase
VTRRGALGLVLAFAVAGATNACSDDGDSVEPAATTADVPDVPPEVRRHTTDWPLPHRDYANSRATTDSTITGATVDRLQEAWRAEIPGRALFGNASSTPLVLGDAVYLQDLNNNVFAVDRETGDEIWSAPSDAPTTGPNGVAVGWGKVFAATSRSEVSAFDADTGEQLWSTTITQLDSEGIDIQPSVYGGVVLTSSVPTSFEAQTFEPGGRGVIHALDEATGAVVWNYDTVASDDLWGNPDVNSGGGAWYPPAVDTESGLTYWGTGNPAPWPGTPEFPGGTSRPGPNRWADSILALDGATGELVWARQANRHDLFDHDFQLVLLADAGGRHLAIGSGKLGTVIAYDAATGDEVWRTPVGLHLNDELQELDGPTRVAPGPLGGVITPMAFADGVVYVPVVNAPATYVPDRPNFVTDFSIDGGQGVVVALDAANGSVLWESVLDDGSSNFGGATVVNDLVLTSTINGTLYALDRATGAVVWTYDADGQVNGWPAVAGDLVVWPIGFADAPHFLALRLNAKG